MRRSGKIRTARCCLGDQRGFTLPELLVVALLAVVGTAAGFAAYSATIRSWEGTAVLTDLQQESSLAVETMARVIREGSYVTIAGTDSLCVYVDVGSSDSLSAVYHVNSDNQLLDINDAVIADRVSSLSFTSADGELVNIDVLLEDDRGTDSTTDDQHVLMSSTVACRN